MEQVLHANPEVLAQMGNEGRRRVRELHDVDVNAGVLASLLRVEAP
jgi:hypothetical protein